MVSKLAIQEIPGNDCKYLRLVDNSVYNLSIPIENGILEITPPGYNCPVIFNVDPYFNTAFNSSVLKTSPPSASTQLFDLPDGIYKIKYSINPNSVLFVEYDLFRNCRQMCSYIRAICDLFSDRCELTKSKFEERRKKLIWIKELIDAAKYMVEEFGDCDAGLDLYNEANSLLKETNDCRC